MSTYVDNLEYLVAVYTYIADKMGWDYGTPSRVLSTDTITLFEPASGYQIYKWISVVKGEMWTWFGGAIQNNLFILMLCLWTDPTAAQCTENVWADLVLNGGYPSKYSIYGVINVWTWEGWLEMVVWVLIIRFFYGIFGNIGIGLLGMIYWTIEDPEWKKPFCKPGELEIFGTDCAEFMNALGYYEGKEMHYHDDEAEEDADEEPAEEEAEEPAEDETAEEPAEDEAAEVEE